MINIGWILVTLAVLLCQGILASAELPGTNAECGMQNAGTSNVQPASIGQDQESRKCLPCPHILKTIPLSAIIAYQRFISPQAGGVCNFEPSCSEFGMQAIKRYGVVEGILMTSDRLQRCHYCVAGEYPPTPKGRFYDPVGNHCCRGEVPSPIEVVSPLQDKTSEFTNDESISPHKSPLATGIMSSLFPGAGQMYLHRFGDGTFSMLLTLGTTGLSRYYLQRGDKAAANILSGLGWTFYSGNIYGAAATAKLINACNSRGFVETRQCLVSTQTTGKNPTRDSLERVLDSRPDDSLRRDVCLAIVKTYIDEGNSKAARFELDQLTPADSELYYWKGITYLHEYKWKAAQAEFSRVRDGIWLDRAQKISPHIEEALHLPYLSEKRAVLLSTIIPGSGQMYAGKVMDGITSLAFNASMVYLIAGRIKADDRLGAGLIFFTGFLRFYHGGRQNALQAVRSYNEGMNSRMLEEIRRVNNL